MENNLLLKATRWDREKAIAYGRKFAGKNRDSSMFVIYTDDYTNFVSQCVWAGYGAYPNPYNYETLKRNARNMHLMVPGEWAADSKGALTNWCNVEDFCNYLKKSKTYGPKAVVDNDQNPWKYLGANSVVHGNIVQFRSRWASTGRYTHSALVCYDQVPASWKKTRVVQYTEADRDLWELITGFSGVDPYADPCYMRVLRVRSAKFTQ
jgi:hypothetical protein